MVQDNDHIQQRGAYNFLGHYETACAKQDSPPLSAVKMHLDKEMLDFNGDRMNMPDWAPILSSICINKHLHHIAISSTFHPYLGSGYSDRRYYKSNLKKISAIRSEEMTFKLCKALRECLTISTKLKTLHLNGLPLRERDLIALSKGLAKSVSLENLSLANCPISDEGLEVICQSVMYSTSIRTLDFTGCNVTWRGAEHMANIVKYQGMQRYGTAWAESLRYQQPKFRGMGGLRRITLNCNILIGDRGAAALAHELQDDLWVKAVDLQKCGLSNEGAHRLLEALKTNSTLHVLDIRNNTLVDRDLIKTIIEKVLINADKQPSEYCWIQPAEPKRAPGPKLCTVSSTTRVKAISRMSCRKGTSTGGPSSGAPRTRKPHSRSCHVPWRAAARAGRQRGMSPGVGAVNQNFQGAATVMVTVESDSDGEEDEDVVVGMEQRSLCLQEKVYTGNLEMELKECRLKLAEERSARLKAESRLTEYELENARLRNVNFSLSEALAATASPRVSALDDEAVLESIEKSFGKFHAFLDLLRDAGLSQLASMAGIDESDFQTLGRPQFSSTMEPTVGVEVSLVGGAHQTVGTVADTSALKSSILPADAMAPRSLPSGVESRLLSLSQDFRPTAEPSQTEAQEPTTCSKPVTPQESCSEHSSYRLSDKAYLAKKSQSDHSKSNGSSDRSNRSHGSLSSRSSINEMFSDKSESAGSHGSRKSGKGMAREMGSESGARRISDFSGLNVGGMSSNDSF